MILRWEILAIIRGVFLLFATQELPYHWLWRVTAEGIIANGAFCRSKRTHGVDRLLNGVSVREDIDNRVPGLGLRTLAVLFLYTLGWIGQN